MGLTITAMARLIALTHRVLLALLDKDMAVGVAQNPLVLRVVALRHNKAEKKGCIVLSD